MCFNLHTSQVVCYQRLFDSKSQYLHRSNKFYMETFGRRKSYICAQNGHFSVFILWINVRTSSIEHVCTHFVHSRKLNLHKSNQIWILNPEVWTKPRKIFPLCTQYVLHMYVHIQSTCLVSTLKDAPNLYFLSEVLILLVLVGIVYMSYGLSEVYTKVCTNQGTN